MANKGELMGNESVHSVVTAIVALEPGTHYGRFRDFWSENCTGVETSKMGRFTFQIIISNHETSFKKCHRRSEN